MPIEKKGQNHLVISPAPKPEKTKAKPKKKGKK